MIAYNRTGLDNRNIQEEAGEALAAGCITGEEWALIRQRHAIPFYAPNIFIRIGLFALTCIIVAFSTGLLTTPMVSGNGSYFETMLIIIGGLCFGALEFVVYNKKHYQSGVDDALLWLGGGFLLTGISVSAAHISFLQQSWIVLLVALYGSIRFIDRVMVVVAYAALLSIVFRMGVDAGGVGKAILPFVIMAVSVGLYAVAKTLSGKAPRHRDCLAIVKATSLFVFYAAGNYLIVRELNNMIADRPPGPGEGITLGWFFWIFTVAVPLFYLYRGVRKKDRLFLWVGLLLVAATLYTIRYYYHVLPAELAMMTGGIVLIGIAYVLIRYLRVPRHGFTYAENNDPHLLENLHLESLVIAESFAPTAATPTDTGVQFGGGSGGGGGAGGQY